MSAPEQPTAHLEWVRSFMEEGIPFNRSLGLRVDAIRDGFLALRLPFRPDFVGDPQRPALHGGTISMLADTAGGGAVFAGVEPGDRVSTIDLRVDYLLPGALRDLVAEATLVRLGNRVGVARIQVWQEADEGRAEEGGRRLVAEGTGVYAVRRS